ncbi:MAG: hypothetical protein MAG794_00426 [Gammaproteobacteria bacterium]|nr:hypothetical protein [Gammaproteobacteria bacterium]
MKPQMTQSTLLLAFATLLGMAWALPAKAVPAFASQTGQVCSYCHTAWPQLSHKGRQFKELGYRLPVDTPVELGDYLQDLDDFPVSALIVSRPYDDRQNDDPRLRVLHEAELIFSGPLNKFSTFFEVEAEDEATNDFGFDIGIPTAVLSYHHNQAFNIQGAWGQAFFADPYGLLGDHFRLTPAHVGVIDQRFDGADAGGRIRDSRQSIGVYGRVADRLFYSAAVAGEADDSEGDDAGNFIGRLAFDITDDIMVGGFYMDGTTGTVTPERDFTRLGLDAQVDVGNLRLQGAYISAEDDNATATAETDNDVFTGQAFYTFKTKTGRPTFVPMIRYDTFEESNGSDTKEVATFGVNYYVTENVKVLGEYISEIDEFDGTDEQDRIRIEVRMVF